MEKTFKNKNFVKRDDTTNIVYCQSFEAPNDNWVPCTHGIPKDLDHLYTSKGVKYYGYL